MFWLDFVVFSLNPPGILKSDVSCYGENIIVLIRNGQ